jgi:hypothetical protein
MSYLFLGDSNFRDLFTGYRERIESEIGRSIHFEFVTSVASVRTSLAEWTTEYEAIYIGCPMNEVSLKSRNNTKNREGIIESVLKDLYEAIHDIALKKEKVQFTITQPFLRQDPPWMETKLNNFREIQKKLHNTISPPNVHLGSEINLPDSGLKSDKVHLNQEGLETILTVVIHDMKVTERELVTASSVDDQEMEDETPPRPTRHNLRCTPGRKRRVLDDNSDDDNRSKKKKTKDQATINTVLDKLDQMMTEMRQDRATNQVRFERVEDRVETVVKEQENLKEEIEAIKKGDGTFAASVREDIDAVDNVNSRDTVIIKKMATDKVIPADKKELSNLILSVGKEVLKAVMGNDTCMKFIAPLFFKNDNRAPREGQRRELPPFKIIFRHLSDAIDFKDKAITASKDPSHILHKAYVACQQNVGTRIRLALLWGVADHLKKVEKKESWVNQSSPKPTLMIRQTGTLVKSYGFIEAMMNYGDKIEQKTKDEATKLAHRFYYGQVEKLFIAIKD